MNKKKLTPRDEQSTPDYLALYGLSESAFSKKPDDKFFYLGTEQARRLTELKHLVQDRNLILNIRGVRGIGKSSLIKRFVKVSDKSLRFCYFSANAKMNSDQMFFNVSAGFGLSGIPDDNKNFKEICINNIKYLEQSDFIPILIIDNVHRFNIDTIKSVFELVNRWDKNHPKLRIILLSDLSIKATLELEEFKHLRILITHIIELEPLSHEQIERYIYHRLSIAGLEGSNPISQKSCLIILDKSKGIPHRINHLCHLALQNGMTEMGMKDFFDRENFNFPIRKYLVTISIMAIFFGILFSVYDGSKKYQEDQKIATVDIKPKPAKVNLDGDKKPESTSLSKKELNIKIQQAQQIIYDFKQIELNLTRKIAIENVAKIASLYEIDKPVKKIKVKVKKIKLTKKIKKKTVKKTQVVKLTKTTQNHQKKLKNKIKQVKNNGLSKYDVNKLTTIISKKFPEIETVKPILLSSVKSERTVSLFGTRFGEKSRVTIYGNGILKEMHKDKIKYISPKQINIKIIPDDYPRKNWIVITDPKKGKSNSKLFEITRFTAPKSNLSMQDAEWILAQKSHKYILHILGSKDKKKIINFKYYEKIKGQYAVFVTHQNGEDWFHLIVGTYKTRYEAKLAIQKFPHTLKKPWIRSIADIQKAIQRLKQKTALVSH